MHALKLLLRWLLILLLLALLGVQVALFPDIATDYSLYFGLAFPTTLLPLIFQSKADTPLYWLLWIALVGASLYYTYAFYLAWCILHLFE